MLMSKIKKIISNNFFQSIATLMSGTLIAQVISFAISPLMTRLYSEEQIGEYTLLLTVVTMFGSVICGRYDMAIVGESDEKGMYALVKLSFYITLVLSTVVSVGYTIYFCTSGSTKMAFPEVFAWILAFILATGFLNILHSYNNRYRDYKLMAAASITKEAGKAVTLAGFGLLHFGTVGLLISYIVSSILELLQQIRRLKSNLSSIKAVTFEDVKKAAKKHIRQPLYSVPASFVNGFSYSIINIFINALFGSVTLAYYSMSYRMLGVPLSLVCNSTSKAYFEKAAREHDQTGNFHKTFLQTSLFLLAIAIPMTAALMILAPWAFELFFGKGWGVSGEYVRYLAPMFGLRLIVSSLSPTMIICNKQRTDLIIQILFVVASCAAYVVGKYMESIKLFLLGITVLYTIVYVLYYLYMLKLSYKRSVQND